MSQLIEIVVPDIGDYENVLVIKIVVQPGDIVTAEQTLIMLESDKATLDVPSPAAGRISALKLHLGDKVREGSVVALLEPLAAAPLASPPVLIVQTTKPLPVAAKIATETIAAPTAPTYALPHASPAVRQLARELGIDLADVNGTGMKGRITSENLHNYIKATLDARPSAANNVRLNPLPWPDVDFANYGAVERTPLSKGKNTLSGKLPRNSISIPHVTNFNKADITDLENFCAEVNMQLPVGSAEITMLACMVKASVAALQKHPTLNAELDGEDLILKRYFHIGFAVDTPNGLVVPVIKDVDKKGLFAIGIEARQLAALASEGKLKPSDTQGGCFTISSLGGIDGDGFTPMINAPEVAILGAAQVRMQSVWDGKAFLPRRIMPVSLSWDHRVIDSAEAARFLASFTGCLEDLRLSIL